MTNLTQNINVPDGCNILTKVIPIRALTDHPHVRIFCAGLTKVIQDKELTLQDVRILFACISLMDFENFLCKSQKEIAEESGTVQPEVSKSLKKLVEKGWLKPVGKIARQNVYKLSPKLVLKARAPKHKKMVEAWNDDHEDHEDGAS